MTEGPKIILPDNQNIKDMLGEKLEEYQGIINQYKERFPDDPDNVVYTTTAGYKAAIVERLFKDGQVDSWKFYAELELKWGFIYPDIYRDAAREINDYCQTDE